MHFEHELVKMQPLRCIAARFDEQVHEHCLATPDRTVQIHTAQRLDGRGADTILR